MGWESRGGGHMCVEGGVGLRVDCDVGSHLQHHPPHCAQDLVCWVFVRVCVGGVFGVVVRGVC